MKTYLTLITLLLVNSMIVAQGHKNLDTAKHQKVALLGSALPGAAVISVAASKGTPTATKRIAMNVTVAKQTQGTAFGEKVNAGLHSAGSAAVANDANLTQSPLYSESGNSAVNPLFESKDKKINLVGPIKGVIVKGGKVN